jgi:hypothetical protein
VPGEEGIVAVKLKQQDIVPVFLWRILHAFTMTEHLMDRHADEAIAAGSPARCGPMISSCEVLYVFLGGLSESLHALLCKQFDIVGYRFGYIVRKLKIVGLDLPF